LDAFAVQANCLPFSFCLGGNLFHEMKNFHFQIFYVGYLFGSLFSRLEIGGESPVGAVWLSLTMGGIWIAGGDIPLVFLLRISEVSFIIVVFPWGATTCRVCLLDWFCFIFSMPLNLLGCLLFLKLGIYLWHVQVQDNLGIARECPHTPG